jgi:hypothetical protein
MLRLLKSIKTALVILFLSITVFVAGSIYIPRNLSLFSDINDIPLFRWLSLNYSSIGKTFWIYLAIFLMANSLRDFNNWLSEYPFITKLIKRST